MRLWTLHPKYLDARGLVALWREALLARAVLRGGTKGYRFHPQLRRFQSHAAARSAINAYLGAILLEAEARGYAFNRAKVGPVRARARIVCTSGQVDYEWRHLLRKLRARSPAHHRRWRGVTVPEPHPLFSIVPGPVESWERQVLAAGRQPSATSRQPPAVRGQTSSPAARRLHYPTTVRSNADYYAKVSRAMPSVKHPGRVEPVHCELCRKEVPRSAAIVPELKDRVMYFCGLDCYEKWKTRKEHES